MEDFYNSDDTYDEEIGGLFEKAYALLDQQRDSEAENVFCQIIEKFPDCGGAYGNRGVARMFLGRDEEALDDFAKVIELMPDDARGYACMAEALRNLGRYEEALGSVARSLSLNPEESNSNYVRGWLFLKCGQFKAAKADFERAVKAPERNGEVSDMLNVCEDILREDLNSEEAESLLRENGFSSDLNYNENFEADNTFCPFAHCVRMQPLRGPESIDACAATGFSCPGGAQQAVLCVDVPFI